MYSQEKESRIDYCNSLTGLPTSEPRIVRVIGRLQKIEAEQKELIGSISQKVVAINNIPSPNGRLDTDMNKELPGPNDALGAIEQLLSQIQRHINGLVLINQSLNEII